MTTRLNSTTDVYVQNEDDLTASGNTGAATGTATRTANINPDIGLGLTKVAIDGDLRTIDTASERLSLDPEANSSGNASVKYSIAFLFRWLVGLVQDLLGRLPSAKGQNAMADSISVAIANNQSAVPGNITQVGGSTVSSTNPLPVRPSISVVRVSCNTLTRPANTTTYSPYGAVSNSTSAGVLRTFSNAVSVNGGSGEIVRAVLRTSAASIPASLRLFLRASSSLPTGVNDGVVSSTLSDYQTDIVGYIDFAATVSGAISEGLLSSGSTMPFACNASNTALYGLLVAPIGWTSPGSGITIDIDLWIVDRN